MQTYFALTPLRGMNFALCMLAEQITGLLLRTLGVMDHWPRKLIRH